MSFHWKKRDAVPHRLHHNFLRTGVACSWCPVYFVHPCPSDCLSPPLCSPISQITNLPQGTLQSEQCATPSILIPSIWIRRATEEGSLFQDGNTCNRCCEYRTDQHSEITVRMRKYQIDCICNISIVYCPQHSLSGRSFLLKILYYRGGEVFGSFYLIIWVLPVSYDGNHVRK